MPSVQQRQLFWKTCCPTCISGLSPTHRADSLYEHFAPIEWQTEAVPQSLSKPVKPWFRRSQDTTPPEHALVIGAGIARAATARKLAEHGVRVTVWKLAKRRKAAAATAKGCSTPKSRRTTPSRPNCCWQATATRRLLQDLLPDSDAWGGDGVLHLNFDEAERKRNQALGLQQHHAHLYRSVSADEAAQIAGIDVFSDGLYWPQGVWLNPPAVVRALLDHPLIALHEDTPLSSAEYDGANWTANTPRGRLQRKPHHLLHGRAQSERRRCQHLRPAFPPNPRANRRSGGKQFSNACAAPYPAKATSARAGKDNTATAQPSSSTATTMFGTRTKKPSTAPPCNNSTRH